MIHTTLEIRNTVFATFGTEICRAFITKYGLDIVINITFLLNSKHLEC